MQNVVTRESKSIVSALPNMDIIKICSTPRGMHSAKPAMAYAPIHTYMQMQETEQAHQQALMHTPSAPGV